MTETDAPMVHVTVGTERRQVSVYAAGTAVVRVARAEVADAHRGGASMGFRHTEACKLVDALAAVTGHYPSSIDAQRARLRQLAAQLRVLRTGDGALAELAELALVRHVGEYVADAAELLLACRDHLDDRTVAELVSELVLMADAMQLGTAATNPEQRIASHYDRIQELRHRLPTPGEDPNA